MNLSTNHSTCQCDYSVTLCQIYSTGRKYHFLLPVLTRQEKKKHSVLLRQKKRRSSPQWDAPGYKCIGLTSLHSCAVVRLDQAENLKSFHSQKLKFRNIRSWAGFYSPEREREQILDWQNLCRSWRERKWHAVMLSNVTVWKCVPP